MLSLISACVQPWLSDALGDDLNLTFLEIIKEEGSDFTRESIDMIRFIDWNERRHRVDAQNYLRKQS